MNFDEYQDAAIKYIAYDCENGDVLYPLLALGEEAGEVQGKVAKFIRKGGTLKDVPYDKELRSALRKELGDVLWNLAALAHGLGLSLQGVAMDNINKLEDRRNRDVIVGEGDDR